LLSMDIPMSTEKRSKVLWQAADSTIKEDYK